MLFVAESYVKMCGFTGMVIRIEDVVSFVSLVVLYAQPCFGVHDARRRALLRAPACTIPRVLANFLW